MIRLGTRGSALALAQAGAVAGALREAGEVVEVVEVRTAGDRGEAAGDKARWVGELERGLRDGELDVAVHSAKDVPQELGAVVPIVAAPPRADARDALVGAPSLGALPLGARVGTSSLRRLAQVRAVREDLEVVPIRGNVDTRLRKLGDGEVAALVLAMAGLERLGRTDAAGGTLDPATFVPAPGQGTLALQARAEDAGLRATLAAVLGDPEAEACLAAERSCCRTLGASCHTPVGAWARRVGGDVLELVAFVGLPDGAAWIRDTRQGPFTEPEALGEAVAARLLAAGAADLLRQAEAAVG